MFGVDFPQTLDCEDRSRALAQQPFQTQAVGAFDAHAGGERETAKVFPACHRLGVLRVERTASG
ncbi:MAG: hypothetical protein RKP46_10825 [Candidatus Accumulibacter sp.]|uniref:hypothetical protein n=1 Tax=Accumulibacter sp. TaxID=2053492 RepID=UPI00287B520B|nr:hypothetical protein [Accumulibacter sp.]MDS4012080.1 hypothetical protein [Defluviicoccus sp.]MDS4014828.1 hypothetical protein [Accumulibacter sp.]